MPAEEGTPVYQFLLVQKPNQFLFPLPLQVNGATSVAIIPLDVL